MGLALVTNLKLYASVTKRLKLKVRKFLRLIPTFAEVTGEKLVGGGLFLDMLQHSMQEIPEWQFVFVKVAGLQACCFIKKRLQHKFFSVNIVKLSETAFL